MTPEVELIPACVECDVVWLPADPERWRLYLTDDDETAWFCPACAAHEFGERKVA